MQLALTFTAINTELNYDYIIVRDGSESFIGELLLEWSGSGPGNEVKVVSSENVMSVTFETDRSITTTGFAALMEVTSFTRDELDCGHRFDCINGVCLPYERVCDNVNECGNGADEDSGNCPDVTESEYISIASVHYFSSPNYPVEYPNSLLYTWYFSTYPGSRLLLTFIDIKTENNYDYITVRDGNASFSGELLLRLSGEVSPNEVKVLSSQNDMLVIFETDTNVQEDGFAALVVVTCLTTAELDCEEEFDCNNGACLPKDRACNGQDECGNDADESNDYCSVDYLTKEVSTDSEISPSTFYAGKTTYSPTIDAGKTTYSPTIEHTVVFVDPAYYFASPNYPRNYPKDLWYTWHISTFPGMRILLTFFEINTEYSYDFVSVREGNTSLSGELLFRMSGVALPHEVKVLSLENGLVVTLETDRSVTSNGFAVVAEITSGDSLDCVQQFNCGNGVCLPQSRLCDGQEECGNGADENHLCKESDFFFVNLTRYFESPNYPANYPKNLNYTWYLSTLPGLQLLLTFFNVSTEYNYDYISVRDGNTSFNGELLLQWSGVSLLDDVRVLSRGNDLIVTFESDRSVTRRGFTFLVETTSSVRDGFDCGQEFNCENGVCLSRSRLCDGYEECGNGADENNDNCIDTITTASPPLAQSEFAFINRSYYFTSPNHPFDYPKNLRYTWHLSTFPGLQLLLTFFEVNTEYLYDFISVREGNVSFNGEVLLRWSGVGLSREVKVLSVGNDLSLTLDTDESVTSEGFTVFVETTSSTKDGIDCGQQFNCGNGVCLPQTRLCDGQQECGNGADEHFDYCLDFTSNDKTTAVPNIAPIINCPTPTSFLQSNENKVISRIDGTCVDVEDGPLSLACNETLNSLQAGDNYIGCSCIDASGSVAECVFIVNVPGTGE
ncbi:CUB and sushi domain-containing protein 1 [Holothuria leucospilota]|uniref:CUB and sushi domain-containing protein 1 n=1 Tax=Holothuria leucospilota TaxID=206669 RepID=A0A9Q1CAJ3_HOLLE|nr:CUB and sushi domain-containing protein 1 [Holothuria leucospilota]